MVQLQVVSELSTNKQHSLLLVEELRITSNRKLLLTTPALSPPHMGGGDLINAFLPHTVIISLDFQWLWATTTHLEEPDKLNFKLIIEISKLFMQWLPAEAALSSLLNLHLQCQNSFVLSHCTPCTQLCIPKPSHIPLFPPPMSILLTGFLETAHLWESLFVSSNEQKKKKKKEQLNYCLLEDKTRASLITLCAAAAELHI